MKATIHTLEHHHHKADAIIKQSFY